MISANNKRTNSTYKLVFIIALSCIAFESRAQLDPFQSMFYQNRYLLNPALAGSDQGLKLNANYKQQWNAFPGTPKTGLFSGDVAASNGVGLGAYVNDDQSGLIRVTKVLGTFAYHIKLNESNNQHLNFGLSLGVNNSRVDLNRLVGDPTDQQIAQYNTLKPYLDGDLGVAYTSNTWLLSATMPNLSSSILKVSDSRFIGDQMLFNSVVAYKFKVNSDYNNITLEPLAGYRIFKNYTNIFDGGINLSFPDYGLNLQTMYHTNKNFSVGAGVNISPVNLLFNYNFETGPISNYTNGTFELALRFHIFKK